MVVAIKNKFLDEIMFTQDKVVEIGEKVAEDSDKTKRGLLDLEAFMNTMVFNEKAARTAMTNQLAEEIDRSVKDYTKKIDDLASYCGNINLALERTTNDLGNLDTEHTNFYYEFQNYKDLNENQIKDIVIRNAMEKMINTLETYEVDVKTIGNRDKTIAAKINLKERAAARTKGSSSSWKKGEGEKELNEMLDRKIDKVYERVRNDNWIIWKESIRLAEKEFSETGIKKTIDLLPKVVYDRDDLKKTINMLNFDDAEQMPKPVIKTGPVKDSPSKKTKSPPNLPPKKEPIVAETPSDKPPRGVTPSSSGIEESKDNRNNR